MLRACSQHYVLNDTVHDTDVQCSSVVTFTSTVHYLVQVKRCNPQHENVHSPGTSPASLGNHSRGAITDNKDTDMYSFLTVTFQSTLLRPHQRIMSNKNYKWSGVLIIADHHITVVQSYYRYGGEEGNFH